MALQFRATGPYSLITHQPLSKGDMPAQEVSAAQIAWLAERGMWATIQEFVSLKCDDIENRIDANHLEEMEAAARLAEVPSGQTVSLQLLRNLLLALGLNVEVGVEGRFRTLFLSPATDKDRLSLSSGAVRKPDTLNYRTYDPEPEGIFCPDVFGPDEDAVHNNRFGHYVMAAPVVPYLWRMGKPSVLEQLLEEAGRPLSCKELKAVVGREKLIFLDSGNLVLREKEEGEPSKECLGTGAEGLRRLLESFQEDQLPEVFRGRLDALFATILLVLPGYQRPIVLLDSGNFATSDLNDLYRRIINRSNRLSKLVELGAPEVILNNEHRMLQKTADQLFANGLLPRREACLGSENRRLKDLMDMVFHSLQRDTKRVDWTGRAEVMCDGDLCGRQALVPEPMFDELQLDSDRPVLLANPNRKEPGFVAVLPSPGSGDTFHVSNLMHDRLDLSGDESPECILHRPLCEPAVEEARQLLKESSGEEFEAKARVTSWINADDDGEIQNRLNIAILSGFSTILKDPRGMLIGGIQVASQ